MKIKNGTSINVLGSVYKVYFKDVKEDSRLECSNGYCDYSCYKIVVANRREGDLFEVSNFEESQKRVLRHEIIHAFHIESGLHGEVDFSDPGFPEMVVDWFAIQSPKIFKVFKELDLLD